MKNGKERGGWRDTTSHSKGRRIRRRWPGARVVVTEMARRGGSQALIPVGRDHQWEAPFGETLSVSKAGDSRDKALQSLTLAANPISTHLLLDGICLPQEQEVRAKHRNATRGFSGWERLCGRIILGSGLQNSVWMLRERQTRGPRLTHWTRAVQAFF